eukprot:9476184-Ditylum_brightwellii.AAC.1
MDVDKNREGSAIDKGENGGGTEDNDNVMIPPYCTWDTCTQCASPQRKYGPSRQSQKDDGDMLLMGEDYI